MKIQRLLAAAVSAALLLSGCSALSLSGSDILAPPKAAGSRAEIQRMIEDDAGGSYTLIYPAKGDFRSGAMLRDIDGDGDDEAVALYTAADGTARVMLADKGGEGYRFIGSGALSSPNVSRLSFADINADGVEEVIVGCDAGAPIAELNAYIAGEELMKVKIAEGFTDYMTGDFDGDLADDVLLLMPVNVKETAKAELMVYSDGSFGSRSAVEIDPNILSYASLTFGMLSEGAPGAVIDGVLESGEYTTQLICYDASAGALMNPLLLNASYNDTRRSCAVTSFDIDGDGVIEFPLCDLMEYAKDEDPSAVCYTAVWSAYDPAELEPVYKTQTILCESLGCMLVLKPALSDTVTARCPDSDTVVLYSLEHKGGEPIIGGAVLTLKRYDKGSFDSSLIAEAVLYESNTSVYTYILADGAGYTDEEIKDSFMLMNN